MSATPRLAIITTHPVQYNAPLFRRLAEGGGVEPHVFYGWEGGAGQAAVDHGFGRAVEWDVPLLDGYPHSFVPNESEDPGVHHRAGIVSPELIPRVDAFRPDAVLVYGWSYEAHLTALRAFHGRYPVLFRGDSTLLDEAGGVGGAARTAVRRLFLRWVYRHVDAAVYVGAHNKAYFRAHGLRDSQLYWAPHAVDNARYADVTGEAEARAKRWRSDLGMGDRERALVFAGKLESKKAPDVLLDAFLSLREEGVHLAIAGSGPLESDLRERASGQPNVHFLGFQNQSMMPVVYRLGCALVLPSRGPGETWGLAVNEAMASGRPAVVSDRVGCAPDLVTAETGRVVPAGNVEALGAALRDVLAPRAAESMGAAARERIDAWSIEAEAERMEHAILTVAKTD